MDIGSDGLERELKTLRRQMNQKGELLLYIFFQEREAKGTRTY